MDLLNGCVASMTPPATTTIRTHGSYLKSHHRSLLRSFARSCATPGGFSGRLVPIGTPRRVLTSSMPLTRKQAWRRVKVRQNEQQSIENGHEEMNAARSYKRPARDMQTPNLAHEAPPPTAPRTASAGRGSAARGRDTLIGSPPEKSKSVLDRWRLPKEGRHPTARPGVTAARRQAAAACVRVGSRVSFNTVVAAILIPSAQDLHAAAREELWWQETDYRDFRINFIQFMRTPTCLDDPEMVPIDIVAESEPPTPTTEVSTNEEPYAAETELKPIIVGDVMIDDSPGAGAAPGGDEGAPEDGEERCVRAYAVKPRSVADDTDSGDVESEVDETELLPAVAAAATAASVVSAFTSSPPDHTSAESSGSGSDQGTRSDVGNGYIIGGDAEIDQEELPHIEATSAVAAAAAMASEYWAATPGAGITVGNVDEFVSRTEVSPSWNSATSDGDDTIRHRRSFSNLETATRRGAGLDSEIMSDCTDSGDDGDESSPGVVSGRPRALSLDGWFTCGLEQAMPVKSYDTHDHAARLRDLVKLPPFPTVRAALPAPETKANDDGDLETAMQRLRVTFNVSVGAAAGGADKRWRLTRESAGRIKREKLGVGISLPQKQPIVDRREEESKFAGHGQTGELKKEGFTGAASSKFSSMTDKRGPASAENTTAGSRRFDLCVS